MSTQAQTALWIIAAPQKEHSLRKHADRALKAAAGFWFVVAVLGQLVFAFTVASFYGLNAARGNWHQWNRTIAETISATIVAGGIDQAAKQYHVIKAAAPATYNFDEEELNALGYQLIQAHQLGQAIRIFQLNIEAYPQSANTWDSLAEAYMDKGDKARAIANYQKSLRINPRNLNATKMLEKLDRP